MLQDRGGYASHVTLLLRARTCVLFGGSVAPPFYTHCASLTGLLRVGNKVRPVAHKAAFLPAQRSGARLFYSIVGRCLDDRYTELGEEWRA